MPKKVCFLFILILILFKPRHIVTRLFWTNRDSNPGPTGYEPVALTN